MKATRFQEISTKSQNTSSFRYRPCRTLEGSNAWVLRKANVFLQMEKRVSPACLFPLSQFFVSEKTSSNFHAVHCLARNEFFIEGKNKRFSINFQLER